MMKRVLIAGAIAVAAILAGPAKAGDIDTFREAKRALEHKVYADHEESFYCGCDYEEAADGVLRPDPASCGLQARKNAERSGRIEWEHVVPAALLGGDLQCWKDGGRRGCRSDPEFRRRESDMHNLVPAVGELNGDRSNYHFGYVPEEPREYGRCNFEVSFYRGVVEPRPEVRGDIARTYFYMAHRYRLNIPPQQEAMFTEWSASDPVDAWERERAARIERLQGSRNTYVSN